MVSTIGCTGDLHTRLAESKSRWPLTTFHFCRNAVAETIGRGG
jgi:hypothetical protein